MITLPAACPSLGTGSTKKPLYPATRMAVRCWGRRCSVILPHVEKLADEILAVDPNGLTWKRHYPELLTAALSDDLGLCPRCLRRIRRVRPSDKVFTDVSEAFAVIGRTASQASKTLDRFGAVERLGDQ